MGKTSKQRCQCVTNSLQTYDGLGTGGELHYAKCTACGKPIGKLSRNIESIVEAFDNKTIESNFPNGKFHVNRK